MSLKSRLSELLPTWLTRKRPANQIGATRPQGGSHPAGGGNGSSGSTGP